jgi:hypothetical protein
VCKMLGLCFIVLTLLSAQRIFSITWSINVWTDGKLAVLVEVFSNAVICWVFLTKSEQISERLFINSDEVLIAITKRELVEVVIIIMGLLVAINSATKILTSMVHYIYRIGSGAGENQDISIPDDNFFSALFMLAGGLLILKHHKRIIEWVSSLPQSTSSD